MESINYLAIFWWIIAIPISILWYMWFFKELINKIFKEKYISKRLSWKVKFDYTDNNWIYNIWKDKQFFELKFSKASDTSIHIYNDPNSIKWVAIADKIYDMYSIEDASIFNMSSRTRNPKEWDIVILENIYWNYCAVKIIDIKYDGRGDDKYEITFDYIINWDWYKDFRK